MKLNISIYSKCVGAYFLSYTGAGKNQCWPSIKKICEDLKISNKTAVKALKELETEGIIIRQKIKKKMFNHNIYTICIGEFSTNNVLDTQLKENKSVPDTQLESVPDTHLTDLKVYDVHTNININTSNIKKGNINTRDGRFQKPTLSEVDEYIRNNHLNVNHEIFYDYYESNGWKVGKNAMKNWHATVKNWSRKEAVFNKPKYKTKTDQFNENIQNTMRRLQLKEKYGELTHE